jgi:hypothetical protein
MFENKRFQSNESGEVVMVVGDSGVFYNLSNGANIKKDIFFQKYSEMAPDVISFFQQQSAAGLSNLAEQLKNVDSRRAVDGDMPPEVKYRQQSVSEQMEAPPEYREMLIKRFQAEQASKDLSQYKVYNDDEEAAADFERRQKAAQQPQQRQRPEPPRQYTEPETPYPVTESVSTPTTSVPSYVSPEEEAFRFFKGFKRVYPIKLSVDFDERIAEPDFIKLMVSNMEGDIIKFYTKEIMNRIYNDPGFLENKIYEKLRSVVFEKSQRKEPKPRAPRVAKPKATKKPVKKTSE